MITEDLPGALGSCWARAEALPLGVPAAPNECGPLLFPGHHGEELRAGRGDCSSIYLPGKEALILHKYWTIKAVENNALL